MQYQDDIFISYSHLDNESPFDDPGWVSAFHRALEVRVAQLLGKKAKIWRDPDLAGNDVFPDQLSERLENAATLVCVLSPRYVESDWCQRELNEFTAAGSQLLVDGTTKARVFKVIKTQVPSDRLPPPVQLLLGYEFFKIDPETKRVRELDVSIDPGTKKDYWARLDDLAHDLRDLLEQTGKGRTVGAKDDKGTVYLAETTLDLKDARDSVRRDLLRHGYSVLPDCSLPLAAADLEAVVREQLGRATLSIHPVGASFGVVPEGTSASMVSIQNELAAECAGKGSLQRLVWMPPDLEVRDDRQRSFIKTLRDAPQTYVASDLLEVPLEDLKTHAHSRLAAAAAPDRESASAAGETPQVYLICDQRDLESDDLAALYELLSDDGMQVVLPTFEGEAAQVRQDHTANLTHRDAFLFYYGAGSSSWIGNQIRELEKSRGYPDKRRELATAIFVAAPLRPQKRLFRTHLTPLVIRERDGFRAAALEPFLKEIENAKARRHS